MFIAKRLSAAAASSLLQAAARRRLLQASASNRSSASADNYKNGAASDNNGATDRLPSNLNTRVHDASDGVEQNLHHLAPEEVTPEMLRQFPYCIAIERHPTAQIVPDAFYLRQPPGTRAFFETTVTPENQTNYVGYRFTLRAYELEGTQSNPIARQLVSLANASQSELTKYNIGLAQQRYGRHPNDTASLPVRIAILSIRIRELHRHYLQNRKDHTSKHLLRDLINERRRTLYHYKKQDIIGYAKLMIDLDIQPIELKA